MKNEILRYCGSGILPEELHASETTPIRTWEIAPQSPSASKELREHADRPDQKPFTDFFGQNGQSQAQKGYFDMANSSNRT